MSKFQGVFVSPMGNIHSQFLILRIAALVERGLITFWISEDFAKTWRYAGEKQRGSQFEYILSTGTNCGFSLFIENEIIHHMRHFVG
jgi:hypothetical protein